MDPAPFIANLTLWFYENKYLEKLYKRDYYSARMMGKSFRLIDDITSVNSDDVFSRHVGDIYPASLTLNNENEINDKANVLDLNVSICGGIGYQVADTGPVGWVNFWPVCSLVPKY